MLQTREMCNAMNFIYNIMLHWELDDSMNIGVCNWGCATHMGDDAESVWDAKRSSPKGTNDEGEILGGMWVAIELFYIYNRKNKVVFVKLYTKEYECYISLHSNFGALPMTTNFLQVTTEIFF